MSKIIDDKTGQSKMISGVNKVVNAIKVTLGPKGKCVAISNNFGVPEITRDGATVAKSITLSDPAENMGALIVKSAAQKTEDLVGDATSSTSILIQEMIKKGQKYIVSGSYNMNEVKSGMDKAAQWVTKFISSQAIPIEGDLEKIRRVATISANNDPEVGDLIVQCMEKVGDKGVIVADISSGLETNVDIVEGFKVNRGWSSPHFITNQEDGTCVMDKPNILVVGEKISNVPQIYPILKTSVENGQPLLIICDDIDEVVLTTLVMNVLQGAIRCCVIKGVDYGDSRKNIMGDIAVAVGATFISPELGLSCSDAHLEQLGNANKVVISKDSCIIYGGAGDKDEISARLDILNKRFNDPGTSIYEKTKFETRISCLAGGIGVIKAGGASEVEKNNRKATIQDAILASKSAISEGVVPGGGYVFLKASQNGNREFIEKEKKNMTQDEIIGANIVLESLKSIIWNIGENSGIQGDVLIEKLSKSNSKDKAFGYNAKTGKFGDLLEMGVLDSAKVLHVALENSVSAASMILLTSCTVTDEPEEKKCCGE